MRLASRRRKPARTCGDVRGRPVPHNSISLQVQWRTGPRTREWNELWRDLLAVLVTTLESKAARCEMGPTAREGEGPKPRESKEHLPHTEANGASSRDSQRDVL